MTNEVAVAIAVSGAGGGDNGGGGEAGEGGASDAWLVVMATPTGNHLGGRHPLPPAGMVLGRSASGFPVQPAHGAVAELESPLVTNLVCWRLRPVEGEVAMGGELLLEPVDLPNGASFELAGYHYALTSGRDAEARYHELIYRMTILDVPTRLHNKRYLVEALERELLRASRHSRPFHAGWLRVTFVGASAHRAVLRLMSQVVPRGVRRDWTAARIDEAGVVVLAPEASTDQVERTLEWMAERMAAGLPAGSSVEFGAMEWAPETPGAVFFSALMEAARDK